MITSAPTTETICSCSSCGQANYQPAELGYAPNGLQLFDVFIHHNAWQRTVLHFCAACLQQMSEVIYPFRSGTPAGAAK